MLMLTGRVAIVGVLCVIAVACGDSDHRRATPTATSTIGGATSTATARPTSTATAPTRATDTAGPTGTAMAPTIAVATATATAEPSATRLPTATATLTATATPTASASGTRTATHTSTLSPTVTATPPPRSIAKRIDDAADLIGGTLAIGRVGDYLIANDKVRAIVRAPGREMSLALLYGGNIVDADLVRPAGEPGHDNFGAMTPLINLSLTANVQEITVVNDGADGKPAVLRAAGVDDLLDAFDLVNAIKAFGFGMVPASAQDRDLPIQVVTTYTLGVGDDAIRIETFIKNAGEEALHIYVGDLLNSSGEDDAFVPPLGFGDALLYGDMPYIAWAGRGSNEGISYGIIPMPIPGTQITASGFGQSGILGFLIGQNFVNALLFDEPGVLEIPALRSRSYVRYFAIGHGDVGSIDAIRNQLLGIPSGTVSGLITAGGRPAAGAFVSVVRRSNQEGAALEVLNSFRTDAAGRYEGTMAPGDYLLVAKLDGYPYDSGTSAPAEHPITVAAGGETVQDVALPDTARLRVTAVDGSGNAIPAKVSVVGYNPAPEPAAAGGTFVFRSDIDQQGRELFGIAAVRFLDQSGDSGAFPLAPADYEVVVSRGAEYSIYRQRVSLTSGATTTVQATLVRVVDTSGFVSSDNHVHLINSFDCSVTRDDRIHTMAAEGVEYFVASDHDFVTDLRPDIARLGLTAYLTAAVSSEVTTFNLGHFNAWPLERDRRSYTGGAIDWGRAGVPAGKDFPSLGSYDLSPAELFATIRNRITPGTDGGIIQVNHLNDSTLGFFTLAGIDTLLDPPRSFTPPELIRQNPAIQNLYDDNYDSLELWVVGNRDQTSLLQNANLGDWFNLLNHGHVKTATADSDTHSTAIVQAGGPRNFVAASSDDPADLTDAEMAANVRDGRVIGSNAPFLRVSLEGDGGATAGLGLGEPKLVAATSHAATLHVNVQSPMWAEFDTLELFANAVPVQIPDMNLHDVEVPRYEAEPTLVLQAGSDFAVRTVVVDPAVSEARRLEADVAIPLTVDEDTWVVVLVKGTDGVSHPIWPMNPQDLAEERNATLDDLTDGNLGEDGNLALAFSNPLFIDVDGNGRFDPPPPR
jgi:hypothetical protein